MRVIRTHDNAGWTFVATQPEEEKLLRAAGTLLSVGELLPCNGVAEEDSRNTSNFKALRFNLGGQLKTERNITRYVGGKDLILWGEEIADRHQVKTIRSMCFCASGGLTFLGETQMDGKFAVIFTGKLCKHCSSPMIGGTECTSEVCNTCAKQCSHKYHLLSDLCIYCQRERPSTPTPAS